jgi:hypothetical protein
MSKKSPNGRMSMIMLVLATVTLWVTAGWHLLKTLLFGSNGNGK